MSPERVFSRCRLTGAIATLWIVLFASISALTLYAAFSVKPLGPAA